MNATNKWITKAIVVILLLLVLSYTISYSASITYTQDIYIVNTDRVAESSGKGARYLVFTETPSGEIEVFENTDSLIFFKFNSSDIQAQIREGDKLRFRVAGWRLPFLSMYRNILKVEKIEG